jgi:ABC-2 type transport system permease protein
VIAPTIALARRALRNQFRRPQFLAPLVVFPSLLLAVNTGGLHATTHLKGFPAVHGFLDFQLAAAMCQSLLLGGVTAGIATALEIEGGFFDRLVSSPIPRVSIVMGRLVAVAVLALMQVAFFLAVGLIFGAHIEGGVLGVLIVLVIGMLAGTGFGAIGLILALRARSAALVQGIFPLVFVILFLSSAFFPVKLLSHPADWVARYNPLSYIADGLRDPIISTVSAGTTLYGLAAAGGLTVVMVALCIQSLTGRLQDA